MYSDGWKDLYASIAACGDSTVDPQDNQMLSIWSYGDRATRLGDQRLAAIGERGPADNVAVCSRMKMEANVSARTEIHKCRARIGTGLMVQLL